MHVRATRTLFASTVFVAAALVFLVQPMIAKQLLPVFGGTPGVWNASVTFFQVALLVGYAIAHVSLRVLGVRRQPVVQLALAVAALAFLPFAVRTGSSPPESAPPALWIAALLVLGVGVPYLAVATASPVLQRWYAALGQPDSGEPWFLYVASNAGSLAGLLAFPVLLEPRFTTEGQERAWLLGFAAYLVGIAACAWVVRRRAGEAATASSGRGAATAGAHPAPIGVVRSVRWLLVAALPVVLMLGATTFITTDVASAPFLWVVPLALYLVSFMVTFGRRWHVSPRVAGFGAAASVLAVLLIELDRLDVDELGRVSAHLLAAFLASVLAHAVLYEDRPEAERLTWFYLLMSVGGALGGTFVSMLAPVAFDDVYEYPLALAFVLLLRPASRWIPSSGLVRGLVLVAELGVAALVAVVLAGDAIRDASLQVHFDSAAWMLVVVALSILLVLRRAGLLVAVTTLLALMAFTTADGSLHRDRNFFGTLRVSEGDDGLRRLLHGTTLHGGQLIDDGADRTPTTYYVEPGPLGDVFRELQVDEPFVEVGVVGLGTGSVLGHARLWQRFSFYEIDPGVIDVARDPDLFTWISDADVAVRVVEGDARAELRDEERRFDVLVLDAYSSDAVPVHLLTAEALELYADRLTDRGVMALHISSRHLALEQVVADTAARTGLAARTREYLPTDEESSSLAAASSQWVVLARDDADLAVFDDVDGWRELLEPHPHDAWTDDFSNVAGTIRWLPEWLR